MLSRVRSMVFRQVVQDVLGVEGARPQVFAGPPRAMAPPLWLRLGADVDLAPPTLLRGELSPQVSQHHPDVGVVAILLGEAHLGGFLRRSFWDRLRHSDHMTGDTLGGCGKCNIPSARNCPSIWRRQASANLSQSPPIFHREVESAQSNGAMFSPMTRQKASTPYCLRNRTAAEPTTVPWRYSAVLPSLLRALRCGAS